MYVTLSLLFAVNDENDEMARDKSNNMMGDFGSYDMTTGDYGSEQTSRGILSRLLSRKKREIGTPESAIALNIANAVNQAVMFITKYGKLFIQNQNSTHCHLLFKYLLHRLLLC